MSDTSGCGIMVGTLSISLMEVLEVGTYGVMC